MDYKKKKDEKEKERNTPGSICSREVTTQWYHSGTGETSEYHAVSFQQRRREKIQNFNTLELPSLVIQ